ncbi:MAG TPA: DUF1801 domain-containing protein [Euzebyales bacterium]|nr:DUF1801 domain-containing protein [Euzebyales bacterium]
MTTAEIADLLAPFSPDVRQIALDLCALVRDVVPDATEEVDPSARLVAFTFIPGTYKGLFAAVALHRSHVNLMFSKGVELLGVDTSGLLEGTGKRARHIKFGERARVDTPDVRALIASAAKRTQRS